MSITRRGIQECGINDWALLPVVDRQRRTSKLLYLLKMRTAGPVKVHSSLLHSDKYYSFEEDLYNHICEAMMILSTGCPMSFFSNPFVKDWLRHLDQKHRPVYHLKLLRIIRCIIDVLQNEVNTISLCTWIRWWPFITFFENQSLDDIVLNITHLLNCLYFFHIINGRWTILYWRVLSNIKHCSLHLLQISGMILRGRSLLVLVLQT